MGTEIERKFLVIGGEWRSLGTPVRYRQGYLTANERRSVRIRVVGDGFASSGRGFITIKGSTEGITRAEYEYEIPLADAEALLDRLCDPPLIEKTRTKIPLNGVVWEVDEFFGANQGLILAEVELQDANQAIDLPNWIGEEVSTDPRYYNSNLAKHPFTQQG
ncbi:MAG: CYTH domain-containing protein [Leptolyngbyaceae cyanobacterium SM1_3_5]|nr:CYTH domain-containing protein [Leptolyngbyaceae cyanobacterium SM1_3_5]